MSSPEPQPTETPTPVSPAPPPPAPPARRSRRYWPSGRRGWGTVLLVVLTLASLGGLFLWWQHSRIEVYTDNAFVVGNITPISSEVSGPVVALYVDDNMVVAAGDPIAQIDPVPFQIQVDQALSDSKQTRAEAEAADFTVRLTRRDRKALLQGAQAKQGESERAVSAAAVEVETRREINKKDQQLLYSLKAQLPGLEALMNNARDYYLRFNSLAKTGDVSIQERDNREAAYRDAVAKVESLKSNIAADERQVLTSSSQLKQAEVKLQESKRALETAAAQVDRALAEQIQPDVAAANALALRNKAQLAESKLELARLNLSRTLIRAPQAGIISRRTIQLGEAVDARKPFLSIVPLDLNNVWILANLRQDQMDRIRVGQPVVIRVDGIPERTFDGWVESVAGGTGSVFSLFPPDNATGNYVRVVQRLPVRIRFMEKENYQNRIRPGMLARVWIDTTRLVRRSKQEW